MNLILKNQSFPACLVDNSVEFFLDKQEVKCVNRGGVLKFDQFPAWIMETMSADMKKDSKNPKPTLGSTDQNELIREHIAKKFGRFDNNPDIMVNGQVGYAEYVGPLELANGRLTTRETEVLSLVGIGLLDKEICDSLLISQNTLRNHKDHISAKAGIVRKTALAILAYRNDLVDII